MKTGLLFGSFNPVHIGHLALANFFVGFTDIQEIWFVVSPQNPLKRNQQMAKDTDRLQMVNLAVEDDHRFHVSDIEFNLPKPSYTITTLLHISKRYPDKEFVLLIGEDNLRIFNKWKDYDIILDRYSVYVYPRKGCDHGRGLVHKNIKPIAAPEFEISSSFIRSALKKQIDVRFFLHHNVYSYIMSQHLYQ